VTEGTVRTAVYASGGSVGGIGTETNHSLAFSTNGTERARITAGGNFGIGVSSPAYTLQLRAPSGSGVSIVGDTNNDAVVLFGDTDSATIGRIVYSNVDDSLRLWANSAERARIKSTGQVRFVPLSADPAGAETGDVYYNSSTNKLRVYNGAWVDLH
jgi:hypothetical protein